MLTSNGQENVVVFLRIIPKGDSVFMGRRFLFFPNNIHRQSIEAKIDEAMTGQHIRKWGRTFGYSRKINRDNFH
jgi:hypothetical protein